MNVRVFLPNKIDFPAMRPSYSNLKPTANNLLKIQQVAGLYPADYIKGFL